MLWGGRPQAHEPNAAPPGLAVCAGPGMVGVRALSRGPRVSKSGSERVPWLSWWKVNWRRPETGGRKTSEEGVPMARSRKGSGHLESCQHDRKEYMSSATCFRPPWAHHRRRALGGNSLAMCPQRAPPASMTPPSSAGPLFLLRHQSVYPPRSLWSLRQLRCGLDVPICHLTGLAH